jgi:hypothetical protein
MCDECVDAHRLEGTIEIHAGPLEITSVQELFGGKPLPPGIESILENSTFCKKAPRLIRRENLRRVYLVPKD